MAAVAQSPPPTPQAPPQNTGPALADLFADDDTPQDNKPLLPSSSATLATMSDLSNPFVMLTYYQRLFPFKQLFRWLSGSEVPTRQFTHREFALTLPNDVYIRYNSYANAEEMKADICKKNPARFEIGPMYSARPKDKKTLLKSALKPQTRELVFDIDMTDYDPIRTCCKDKAMCKRCWKFIAMAVKVLDETLRTDFGFQHLLWVYSGRRGIHCWISDPSALLLTDDQRRAIVNYIELIKGDKKVDLKRPLHPAMQRSFDTLRRYFGDVILKDQDCFKVEEQWSNVLNWLPDKDRTNKLQKQFANSSKSSIDRWAELRTASGANDMAVRKYRDTVDDIILTYTYPRIDTEVSKKLNHLLKSPFCIHPGTGRVCVPLTLSQIETFIPENVPTVGQLLMELEQVSSSNKGANLAEGKLNWEQTSLKPYVEVFQEFVDGVVKAHRGVKKEAEVSMEF